MTDKIEQISSPIEERKDELQKISFSSPVSSEYKKISVRPILIKGSRAWQAERFTDTKVYHLNLRDDELASWVEECALGFSQICLFFAGESVTFSRKGDSFKKKVSKNDLKPKEAQQNNRQKNYLLREGEYIPALVELGVFTHELKVARDKQDKFRQINRFVELIDDAFSSYQNDEICILDFGCGKSYLTFIVYYYFTEIKKVKAKIIGYDLKEDVVKNCNAIAKKYGYNGLEFFVSDVTRDVLYDRHIDMIVSLHACDTATDYALFYAIQKNVKHIFSVPCCQHEINSTIKRGGELDVFLKYGIVKERMSALLTDTIRAMILEDMGYSVDMIEFVDLEQSPKNLMLRAKKSKLPMKINEGKIKSLIDTYSFKQSLWELTHKQEEK